MYMRVYTYCCSYCSWHSPSPHCFPAAQLGNTEQKHQFLSPCASGKKLGCFMLSEPGNGSDASAASTTARKDGNYYVRAFARFVKLAQHSSCRC
jgi:alkylation response protein AidB-like acyl-CoA dehydrogenase